MTFPAAHATMKNLVRIAAVLALIMLVAGCSSLFGSGSKSGDGAGGLSEADLNAQREGRFGSGDIPTAEGEGLFRDIRFDYDSSVINDVARQDVEYNAEVLRQNSNVRVQLEGHCDERGTAEYNMALGSARARAVQELLISYGIPSNRLETISYGEEVPLVSGQTEEAWAQNRRVHFSAFGGAPAQ